MPQQLRAQDQAIACIRTGIETGPARTLWVACAFCPKVATRGDLNGRQWEDAVNASLVVDVSARLGVRVLRDPGVAGQPDATGSFSWSGLAHSDRWIDPVSELVRVVMTQLAAPPLGLPVAQTFETLAYQAMVG